MADHRQTHTDDHSTSTTGSSDSSSSSTSSAGPPAAAATFPDLDATIDSTNLDVFAGLEMDAEPSSAAVDGAAAPSSSVSSEPTARPVAVASALRPTGGRPRTRTKATRTAAA
ncbi:hypothetical protein ACHAXS_010728 [Conticribra weissflogii]